MKKTTFEELTPVTVTVEGQQHVIAAPEFARICKCAVKGKPGEITEKIVDAQLTGGQKQALESLKAFADSFGGKDWDFTPFPAKKKGKYEGTYIAPQDTETPEQKKQRRKKEIMERSLPRVKTDKTKKLRLPYSEFARICPCGVVKVLGKIKKMQAEV